MKGASGASGGEAKVPVKQTTIVRLKYEMCKNFRETGTCKYGDRCLFAHGDHELINRGATATSSAPPASSSVEKKEEDKKEPSEVVVTASEEEKSKVV